MGLLLICGVADGDVSLEGYLDTGSETGSNEKLFRRCSCSFELWSDAVSAWICSGVASECSMMPDESGSSIWTLGVSAAGAGASISWTFEAKRTAGADVFITVWGEDGSSPEAFDPSTGSSCCWSWAATCSEAGAVSDPMVSNWFDLVVVMIMSAGIVDLEGVPVRAERMTRELR